MTNLCAETAPVALGESDECSLHLERHIDVELDALGSVVLGSRGTANSIADQDIHL